MSLFAHTKKRQSQQAKLPETPPYTPFSAMKNQVLSPADGTIMPVDQSQDPVFASGKVGTGVILFPAGDTIKAPVSGKVLMIFPSKSSISIEDEEGREILLHLGMGTSRLEGKPFTCYVEPNQKVEAGQPLMKANWDAIAKAGCSSELAIVLPKKEPVQITDKKDVKEGDLLFEVLSEPKEQQEAKAD